jgi:hypothetical protein
MTAETTYFPDPHLDRTLRLVWQLAGELQVTRQRLAALEAVLARTGAVPAGAVDDFHPHPSEAEALRRHRDGYVDRLARVVAEHGPAEHPLRGQWLASRRAG